jgi:hypothetical protein
MKTFSISRLGSTAELATIQAHKLDYTGGDGTVIAVFRADNAGSSRIVALVTLENGLIVQETAR